MLDSIESLIGRTPLLALDRISAGIPGRVLAKLENKNPGGSKKDRVAWQIIKEAREAGELKNGQTVIEATSGNTGASLAIVCRHLGHPFIAVISKGNTIERCQMMQALGARVVRVDQSKQARIGSVSGDDFARVEETARSLAQEKQAFCVDQFQRPGNLNAHYQHTGPEIIEQSRGAIDGFCDFVGSGGTYAGCSRAFKDYKQDIQCYVIEPLGAETLSAKSSNANQAQKHEIQGGGYNKTRLPLMKQAPIDGYLSISSEEAKHCTRRLAEEEGIFAGISSGANLAGALRLLAGPLYGKTVVIIINDTGFKYLSTSLWKS